VFQLHEGILYSILATLVEYSANGALRLQVPVQCRGHSLRSDQRFTAYGVFTLIPDKPLERYIQSSPVPINISIGGFGLQLENLELEPDQEVSFQLRVLLENHNPSDLTTPVLELSGIAIARYSMQLDSSRISYCGFQFHNLPEEIQGSLAFWIKAHQALLRAT
jgi:hypothetical protein